MASKSRTAPGNDELPNALRAMWRPIAVVGLFSSAINLLYLNSPLYLMQVYNRVLVSENVTTLLMIALATMWLSAPSAGARPWSG